MRDFINHPRKEVIREKWNTPLLKHVYGILKKKYFYVGLPGPEALDIKAWQTMINRVVAFETGGKRGNASRKNIIELNRNLALLNIPNAVYFGSMEEVLLQEEDDDGKILNIDKFVTLFNLDFCNCITSKVYTSEGSKKCLRFEAIRRMVAIQLGLSRRSKQKEFILLFTAYDSFDTSQVKPFLLDQDLPMDVICALEETCLKSLPEKSDFYDTNILKVFIFQFLRKCFQGQGVSSFFLPPISYFGGQKMSSPMIHFAVVCSINDAQTAVVADKQSAEDFLKLDMVYATDSKLETRTQDSTSEVVFDDFSDKISGFLRPNGN